ncbi:DUF3488 and transglutaminase-like domain-containing protein [Caenimonas koreensis]|uniref:DUF3488 domain-containing protein n=1 Tax=Caenimonas koreensis DSM 17982 TaxID=1121255 RepID=A0A844BFD8_9BURK|nr:DUF3488 and transglutaminase-like domain-containing protein [Caenimonas koreensis]MRD49171.1 DUF3488 domain-containing protein [Caenimonas koreensis DSM 17982]
MLSRIDALPRDSRDTLFLLLVIAWIVLPQVANLPVWCVALTGGVLLWRGWLAFSGKPLPGKWWILGLLVVATGATLFTHRTVLGRDAGVTMIVVLLAFKTLELRARRDIFVVFFLGFFTMLTNFFFSQSLLTAAAMLVALLGLLTALVNAHMPVGKPPLRQAAKTAMWMALLGAPVMAVMFVLFPRLAPLWGIPSDAMSGRSGLSATMQVGNIASLVLDESIAMRIQFEGAAPQQSDLYFRGPVLGSFDGREWRAIQLRLGARNVNPLAGPAQLQVSGTPVKYEVTMEANNRPWLMVLDAAIKPPNVPGFETAMTGELLWLTNRPITDLLRYKAESYTNFRHGPGARAALQPDYMEIPLRLNPRTQALALQLSRQPGVAEAGDEAFVDAAMKYLRSGNYRYTLEPGQYGENTADEFWFDKKEGFCEHIASAFAVLMRAGGVPSRVVTGYQGGERNTVDGFWVLRQSDAHAWTEVWLERRGWVRVDPTSAVAPGRIGAFQRLQAPQGVIASALGNMSPGLAANMRAAWEALNNSWNQWVLNYTQSKQLNMLKDLGFESPSWEDLSYVLLGLIVAVSLLGAGWTLWDKREHDPWLRLLQRVRKRLVEAGIELPAAAPPRHMAAAVTARFGDAGRDLASWLLKLESLRYARSSTTSLSALQREFKQMPWPA